MEGLVIRNGVEMKVNCHSLKVIFFRKPYLLQSLLHIHFIPLFTDLLFSWLVFRSAMFWTQKISCIGQEKGGGICMAMVLPMIAYEGPNVAS